MINRHEIRTVADFSAIPSDKITACLNDFAEFLEAGRKFAAFPDVLGDLLGVDAAAISFRQDVFVWLDDGISGMSSLALVGESGEVIGLIDLIEKDRK